MEVSIPILIPSVVMFGFVVGFVGIFFTYWVIKLVVSIVTGG